MEPKIVECSEKFQYIEYSSEALRMPDENYLNSLNAIGMKNQVFKFNGRTIMVVYDFLRKSCEKNYCVHIYEDDCPMGKFFKSCEKREVVALLREKGIDFEETIFASKRD